MPTKAPKQPKKKEPKSKAKKSVTKEKIFTEFISPDEQKALYTTLQKYQEAQAREQARTDQIHEKLVNEHRKRLRTATLGEDTCTHCGKRFVKFFNNEYKCTICKKKIDRFCVSFQYKDVTLCKLCQHNTIAKGTSGSWYFDYLKKGKMDGRISDIHPIKALSNSLERIKSENEKHESANEADTDDEEEIHENQQESPMKRIGLVKREIDDNMTVTTKYRTETVATCRDDTKSLASVQMKEGSLFKKHQKAVSEFNPKSFLSIGSNISSAFSSTTVDVVQGRVLVSIDYIASKNRLKIFVFRAENLVMIPSSRGSHLSLSNLDEAKPPNTYVKCYLLPEQSETKKKLGKQKTNIIKKSCEPKWQEEISYTLSEAEVRTKTLNCAIWHNNDRKTGKNMFLGEFNVDFDQHKFNPEPVWYDLVAQNKKKSKLGTIFDLGDITLAIKFEEMSSTGEEGILHVWVKSGKNLNCLFNPKSLSEGLSPMVKIYLNKTGNKKDMKQKSITCPNTREPVWNNAFMFENVKKSDLPDRGVQVEVYNDNKKAKSECISMCRLNLGTEAEPWMDAHKNEQLLWKTIIVKQNKWAEATIPLREFKS